MQFIFHITQRAELKNDHFHFHSFALVTALDNGFELKNGFHKYFSVCRAVFPQHSYPSLFFGVCCFLCE